jgi:hypothetical protein
MIAPSGSTCSKAGTSHDVPKQPSVQVLPSASDETLKILEENIRMLPNVSDFLAMGMGLDQLVEVLLDGIGVDEESRGYMTASYGPCEKVGLQVQSFTCLCIFWISCCDKEPARGCLGEWLPGAALVDGLHSAEEAGMYGVDEETRGCMTASHGPWKGVDVHCLTYRYNASSVYASLVQY